MTLPLVESNTTILWPLQFIALMLTHTYLHEGSSWKFEIPIHYYIAIKTITDGTPWSISFYLKWSSLQKWQKSFKYPHPYMFSYFALFRWPCLLHFWNWIWKELDTDQHKKWFANIQFQKCGKFFCKSHDWKKYSNVLESISWYFVLTTNLTIC